METMTEGKAVEELKLPSSSLGLPGLTEHLSQAKESLCNGIKEHMPPDRHINGVLEGGSHENGSHQEGIHGVNNGLLLCKLGSMNGGVYRASPSPKDVTCPCVIINGEAHGTPSPQSVKFPHEHKGEGFKHDETLHCDDKETVQRQGNWVYAEILVLLEAKAKEYGFACGDNRNRLSADEKWKQVSEYCKSKGVLRTKEQCRVKWDNLMPDYRKVRDYEEQRAASATPYFEMDVWERRMKLLPGNMDMEIYYRIASIQSNKPSKGRLKREAREKKALEFSHMLSPSLQPLRKLGSGAGGITGTDLEGERPLLADLVGKLVASSASRKRRRRRAVELSFQEKKLEPVARSDDQMHDDSSTEDDAAVVSSRSQQGTPLTACMYAERSSVASHPRLNFENRELLPVAYRSQCALQQAASVLVERGNSSNVLEGMGAKRVCRHESSDGMQNHDAIKHVEDRKDARHRELMALEREKLAVFREASFAIASAMTNAMTVFSKVAEELLLRRG